ncbi:MAG: response regulator transcription factor [Anaerolineales bacterium]|nr:response regulator transcription factor [Anaerolineales bacterium]
MNQEKDPQLTEHEKQVLRLVVQGLTNKEIARALNIAERTVEYHLGEIFQRLEVSSRTAAVVKAEKLKLLDV